MSLADQIKAAERELGMRKVVYARRVAAAKMTQAAADHEMSAMAAIVNTLKDLALFRDQLRRALILIPE